MFLGFCFACVHIQMVENKLFFPLKTILKQYQAVLLSLSISSDSIWGDDLPRIIWFRVGLSNSSTICPNQDPLYCFRVHMVCTEWHVSNQLDFQTLLFTCGNTKCQGIGILSVICSFKSSFNCLSPYMHRNVLQNVWPRTK